MVRVIRGCSRHVGTTLVVEIAMLPLALPLFGHVALAITLELLVALVDRVAGG